VLLSKHLKPFRHVFERQIYFYGRVLWPVQLCKGGFALSSFVSLKFSDMGTDILEYIMEKADPKPPKMQDCQGNSQIHIRVGFIGVRKLLLP